VRSVTKASVEPESTAKLLAEAAEETVELVRLEVMLARNEARGELVRLRAAAIGFAVATACATAGMATAIVGVLLWVRATPRMMILVAGALLVAAAAIARAGWRRVPKEPLARTRRRIEREKHELAARVT